MNKFYTSVKTFTLLVTGACTTAWAQTNPFDARSHKTTAQPDKSALHAVVIRGYKNTSPIPGVLTKQASATAAKAELSLPLFIEKNNQENAPKFKTYSVFEASDLAKQFLQNVKTEMHIKTPEQEFKVTEMNTDELAKTHIRLEQSFQGIPVYGAEIILHATNGSIHFLNGRYFPTPDLSSLTAQIDAETAIKHAASYLGTKTRISALTAFQQKISHYTGPKATLMIYHLNNDLSKEKLVWVIKMKPNVLESWNIFVDAQTGLVVHGFNQACTADGPKTASGNDLNNVSRAINTYQKSTSYYLIDATRAMYNAAQSSIPDDPAGAIWTLDAQNTSVTNVIQVSNTTNSGWPSKAISAHYNAGIAYDYYRTTFNRNSINGQGGTITSIINVSDENGQGMDNAYWTGEFMCYGNGKVAFKPLAGALDVAGHEMTHGVVQNSANLEYEGQSGAINESMADIFGCMMDRNDWLMGEDVTKTLYFPSGALRSLQDPHNGGTSLSDNGYQPRVMSEYYTGTSDNGGVHTNSGIPNWAFYKFATAVTKEHAEQIYYKALTAYLTKTSQFVDLRIAVVQSAIDLYGASSAEVTEAKNAFSAVGIYANDPGGGSTGGGGTNSAVDLATNPGQDYILSYDLLSSDPVTLYSSSTTGTNYVSKSQFDMKRKPSVVDNGSSCIFVGDDSKIYSLNLTGTPNESVISNQAIWDNAAVAKDASRIAAVTSSIDTSIYVYDYTLSQWKQFILYNPTYTQGVDAGGVLYADAIEWDYSGQYIIYDAKNVIDNPVGADIVYWDIGMIKVWDNATNSWGDGSVQKLYTQLPEDISIGNPSFSKNSPYIITFDYIDSYANSYTIMAKNIITGEDDIVFNNTKLGFPCYSKLDNKIIFDAVDGSNNDVIGQISLTANKLKGTGSATILIPDAQWGIWYAQGTRSLRSSGKDITAFTFPALNPPVTATISGTNINALVSMSTNVNNLVPSFSNSPLSAVYITGTKQISGVTTNNYTNPVTYTVKAEDGTSKTYTVTVTKQAGTGIQPIPNAPVYAYPNPAHDALFIAVKGNFSYTLYDLNGREMLAGKGDAKQPISLSGIQQGMYIIKLTAEDNKTYVIRFSKN